MRLSGAPHNVRTDPALIRGSPIRSVSNRPVVVRCGIRPGRNKVSEVDLFPSYCIALQVLVAHAVGPGRGVNVGHPLRARQGGRCHPSGIYRLPYSDASTTHDVREIVWHRLVHDHVRALF